MYGGLFSPVEAAAVGAGAVIAIGMVTRTMSLTMLWAASKDSVVTTATPILMQVSTNR